MYLIRKKTLDELGIKIRKEDFSLDSRPLLKLVLTQFFGDANGFVDMCVKHIPSPAKASRKKVAMHTSQNSDNRLLIRTLGRLAPELPRQCQTATPMAH